LYEKLKSCNVKKDLNDNWFWFGEGNEIYTVKLAYNKIRNNIREVDDKLFFKL